MNQELSRTWLAHNLVYHLISGSSWFNCEFSYWINSTDLTVPYGRINVSRVLKLFLNSKLNGQRPWGISVSYFSGVFFCFVLFFFFLVQWIALSLCLATRQSCKSIRTIL
uniref:Uncharacterized protein n=1 Tax=Wolfiporia cocos TaxID=81056 RepID=A0A7G7YDQ8_9APHY|nr:hypothetical protein [Wolfiporia cocos]QNH92628.1 hypothetical protein [Wolfiporia cocos]